MSNSPLEYDDRINPDLRAWVPADSQVVVEIGCGSGALGAAVKKTNPSIYYIGVEIDVEAAAIATERLDRVIVADVSELESNELILKDGSTAIGRIDCLVYGNVLEHVTAPWSMLKQHAGWLNQDGIVLASIPNIQNWRVILSLLQGQWQYQEDGVLDQSQLRFFTYESIRELFDAAGLCIVDSRSRQGHMDSYGKFARLFEPIVKALGVNEERFKQRTEAVQYVVRAMKHPPASRLLIQTLTLKPQAGMNDVRVRIPDMFVNTIPGVRTVAQQGFIDPNIARPKENKVLVWQRPILRKPDALPKLKKLIEKGYLIVVECDDYPHRPEFAQHDYLTFNGVHAVQTSTQALADVYRQYNPNVGVMMNQIAELEPMRDLEKPGPIKLFFGALNRADDWSSIMDALNEVIANYKDDVFVEVVHDQKFYDALMTASKRFHPTCRYERYQEILRGCDIALLPLRDTEFNRSKSDLKFIECAALGVVVLASPTVYGQTVENGNTGLIFGSSEDFEIRLRMLLDDKSLRKKLAVQAYDYVKSNRMQSQHYRKRVDWYNHLIDRLPQLNEELRRRVPAIFTD